MIRSLLTYFLISSFACAASAALFSPATLEENRQTLSKVGEGTYDWLFWDAYHIGLWAPQGQYSPHRMHALKLRLDIDISNQSLLDELSKQLQRMGVSANVAERWSEQMRTMFPEELQPGDEVTIITQPGESVRFRFNGMPAGTIDDNEFSYYLSQIWLREDGPRPKLARQLKGIE
jgi:hypothetical protein